MDKRFFYFNEKIVSSEETVLRLGDLALFRAYGVFDYFRTVNRRPFMMEDYLHRFRRSADLLHIPVKKTVEELAAIINELLKLNNLPEAGIRVLQTGGYSDDMFTPGEPNLIIRVEPLNMIGNQYYRTGIKLATSEYMRDCPDAKTINYINAIWLWPEVKKAGASEILYHQKGQVLECTRSNFFLIKKKELITPVDNVLHGITRKKVIELAHELGYEVHKRDITLSELYEAEEAFITGTTKRVLPVVQVDDISFGNSKPGPLTKKLMDVWWNFEQSF